MTDTTALPKEAMRSPIEHEIKCWPLFYSQIANGKKPFELRKNDRDYQLFDTLLIREWCGEKKDYTGRSCRREITYMLNGPSDFGLGEGYCILGLKSAPLLYDPADALPKEAVEAAGKALRECLGCNFLETSGECVYKIENGNCGCSNTARAVIRAALPHLSPAPPLPGWKLVPIEPTQEMERAANQASFGYPRHFERHYRAMLAAAPDAPAARSAPATRSSRKSRKSSGARS